MHYDVPFEKPQCFLLLEFFFFYYREYSSTVEPLFLLQKLLGFSFVQHWYYFSLFVCSKHYTFFFYTLHSCYLCKMFCLFFFASKPALLFVPKNLHCFFLSLTFAFKMRFFLPTEILFVFFLSLTSMLKILFFFYLVFLLKWSEFLLFYGPPLPCATRVN